MIKLIELTGLNDAPVLVNPAFVATITAGTTLGTTHVTLKGAPEPIVVQGQLRTIERALSEPA